jgi:hypothetical protein
MCCVTDECISLCKETSIKKVLYRIEWSSKVIRSKLKLIWLYKAVLPLRRRDCDSIKKKHHFTVALLVEPSVRNGASPTSATTML